MENKQKIGHWIHQKVNDNSAVNGFFYERECTCSECGFKVSFEKKICPHCGAIMDDKQ